MTLDECRAAELSAGLGDRENPALRVRWVSILRAIVAEGCPKNRVGAALVSDIDLLLATAEQRHAALAKL